MNDVKKLRCNYAVVITETDAETGEPTWEYLIARCPDLSTAEATLALHRDYNPAVKVMLTDPCTTSRYNIRVRRTC